MKDGSSQEHDEDAGDDYDADCQLQDGLEHGGGGEIGGSLQVDISHFLQPHWKLCLFQGH